LGQATLVDRPAVKDSAALLQQVQHRVDSLSLLIPGTLEPKALANIYVTRGIGYGILNQPDSAIHDFSRSIVLNPQFADAYVFRAAQYQRLKNYDAGIADVKKALALLKDNPMRSALMYSALGFMQLRLKNYDNALEADSASLALNPNNGFVYINNGWAYLATKNYDKAIESFNAGLPIYRNANKNMVSEVLAAIGDAKRALKKYRDAINDYALAIGLNPDNKHAHWNRAACYNNNGDYELADAEYTKTIAFYTRDSLNLAKLYDDRARTEIAEQKYKEALRDDSLALMNNKEFGPAYWNMADAYAQNGDFQESINWYKQTLKYYADRGAISVINDNIAGEAYFLAQYDQVITSTTTAIDLDAQAWSPHLNRGRAYLKLGQKERAATDFNQVLALDTTKKSYEYAFALFYTGNADKAVQLMQDNIIGTTNPAILTSHYHNLACLYSLMNKPDEANAYLKRCIDSGYSKNYARNDPDLKNIRDTPDFKAMIAPN
jgi:tetratricopeptide (TPR) repeat protein